MKVITEAILRDELRASKPETYVIPEGQILSPAAREYLQQLKIKIIKEKDKPLPKEKVEITATEVPGIPESAVVTPAPPKPKYVDYETNAYYYEKPMVLPSYKLGKTYALLNQLRTAVRETEVAAAAAFHNGKSYDRADIIEELNRMSSAVHIIMCKYLAKIQNQETS